MLTRISVIVAISLAHPLAGTAQTHAPIVDTAPEPSVVQGCGHYAVIGAVRSLQGAFDLQDHLGATGAGVLDNEDVDQFRDGFHSIVFGPFGTQAMAEDRVTAWRGRSPDTYVKFGCVEGAEVSTTDDARLSEPLPIPRGLYVLIGVSCDRPPNAAVWIYDGVGLSGSATRNCRFTVADQAGPLYGGSNSCTNIYDGSRTSIALSVRVLGSDRFRLAEYGTVEGDFRFCTTIYPGDFERE